MSDFTISWNSSKTKHCENYHGKPTRIATSLAESWSSQRRHENRFVHFSTSLWVPHRLEDLLKMGEGVACRATQVMGHAHRHAPLSIWPAPFHFSLSKPPNVIIKRCKRRMMKAETGEHQKSMLKQQQCCWTLSQDFLQVQRSNWIQYHIRIDVEYVDPKSK